MGTRVKQLRTVATFAVILSILCAAAIYAARSDSSRMKTIFVFGDSLSDGFQLKRSQAYPALLLDKLIAKFAIVISPQLGLCCLINRDQQGSEVDKLKWAKG
jgi:hypothetical protein